MYAVMESVLAGIAVSLVNRFILNNSYLHHQIVGCCSSAGTTEDEEPKTIRRSRNDPSGVITTITEGVEYSSDSAQSIMSTPHVH